MALNNQITFESLTSKLDIRLTAGKSNINAKGEIRILNERAIQISVQPFLGIEVLRLCITPDTLLIIDRINKRYLLEESGSAQAMLPEEINFRALQAMLTNQLFHSNRTQLQAADARLFRSETTAQGTLLKAQTGSLVNFAFSLDDQAHLIRTSGESRSGKQLFQCDYSDFRTVNSGLFPSRMQLAFELEKESIAAELRFGSVDLNRRTVVDLTPPSRYQRMTPQELLTLLTKLR